MATSDRHQPADLEAFRALMNLHVLKVSSDLRRKDWDQAQDRLETLYTRDHATKGSVECTQRIAALRVPEPEPAMEDSYPDDAPPFPNGKCVLFLNLVQRSFDTSRAGYLARERVRRKELTWAQNLLEGQQRAEVAQLSGLWSIADRAGRSGDTATEGPSVLCATLAETPEQLDDLFRERKMN